MLLFPSFLLFVAICKPVLSDFAAPRFKVDLELSPDKRWNHVFQGLVDLHGGWEHTGAPAFAFLDQLGTPDQWDEWNTTLTAVGQRILGDEIVAEGYSLVKFANQPKFKGNITLGAVCFFQLFYELAMQCTGTLAKQVGGGVVHGRNMDIGLAVENLTAQVDWHRDGGDPIVTSTQFMGYSGIHSGMRHDGWTIQANERVVLEPGPGIGYKAAIALTTVDHFATGATPVGLYLRDALLSHPTLDTVLPYLERTHLASPMYLIIGGANDGKGMVLTRDRDGLATLDNFGLPITVEHLPDTVWSFDNQTEMGKIFHVHTNFDAWINEDQDQCYTKMASHSQEAEELCEWWISHLYADQGSCNELCQLYSDGRQEAGDKQLADIVATQQLTVLDKKTIFEVMSTPPVLASGTKFTTVMSAATNYYNTTVRVRNTASRTPDDGRIHDEALLESAKILLNGMLRI